MFMAFSNGPRESGFRCWKVSLMGCSIHRLIVRYVSVPESPAHSGEVLEFLGIGLYWLREVPRNHRAWFKRTSIVRESVLAWVGAVSHIMFRVNHFANKIVCIRSGEVSHMRGQCTSFDRTGFDSAMMCVSPRRFRSCTPGRRFWERDSVY
ncbi:hypothetical protein BDV95DRAFT_56347 [Massariosphaeria phaeospora]|uniref:Uncharacterized protein n=1 Tax=Massariosphaeria phaeospora TaxID=100035 RepID=A0A7C8MBD7_9PLEO|nr:hypothetical protein BDV95DRAFT_56347 [Massariosphaeria phaeospora]